jgi:hypothetical protein
MLKASDSTTWYAYVLSYVDKRWPGAAANTRKSMLEALGTVTAALVDDRTHRPDFADLYRVLVRYALPPSARAEDRPPDDARILRWLEAASVPLVALEDEDVAERALSAIALRLDGKAAAATVIRRKRAVFYNVLDMAASGKGRKLTRNPLDTMRWKPPPGCDVRLLVLRRHAPRRGGEPAQSRLRATRERLGSAAPVPDHARSWQALHRQRRAARQQRPQTPSISGALG